MKNQLKIIWEKIEKVMIAKGYNFVVSSWFKKTLLCAIIGVAIFLSVLFFVFRLKALLAVSVFIFLWIPALYFICLAILYFLELIGVLIRVEEGTAVGIYSKDKLITVRMSYGGNDLDEEGNVKKAELSSLSLPKKMRNYLLGGLHGPFLPFFHHTKLRDWRWSYVSQEEDEKTGKVIEKIVVKDKKVSHVYVRPFPYAAVLENLEPMAEFQVAGLQFDVTLIFTMALGNVYRPIINSPNWLDATLRLLLSNARECLSNVPLTELLSSTRVEIEAGKEKQKKKDEQKRKGTQVALKETLYKYYLEKKVGVKITSDKGEKKEIQENVLDFLYRMYGPLILDVSVLAVEPSGKGTEKALEILRTAFEGEQKGLAKERQAKGEAGAIKTINDMVKSFGELGLFMEAVEAIKESSKGPGNVIFPFGSIESSIKSLIQSVNPKKDGDLELTGKEGKS